MKSFAATSGSCAHDLSSSFSGMSDLGNASHKSHRSIDSAAASAVFNQLL